MAKISTIAFIVAGILILTSLVTASGMLTIVNYVDPTPTSAPVIVSSWPSGTSAAPSFIGPPQGSSWAPTITFSYAASSTGIIAYVTSVSSVIYASSGTVLNSQSMNIPQSWNDTNMKTTEWTESYVSDSAWPGTGYITFTYSYFDHSSSGNSNSATLTYTAYWSLVAPSIVGTWKLDGVTVTSTTQTINVTSASLHIYFIPTTTTLPFIKSIYVTVKQGTSVLSNTTATLQGNDTYYTTYTLPSFGTYNVQGYVHNQTSTVQTLSLTGNFGTSSPPPTNFNWFIALLEVQLSWMSYIFYAGIVLAGIGVVTKVSGV